MSKSFIAAGIVAAGLAMIGAYSLTSGAVQAQDANDGPGPNLMIEVDGSTTGTITIDLLPEVAQDQADRLAEFEAADN